MLRSAYDAAFATVLRVVERDLVPDSITRTGIRYLLSGRVKEVGGSMAPITWSIVALAASAAFAAAAANTARLHCPLPQTTDLPSEEHYARLQAFRDELAGMPVAVQV